MLGGSSETPLPSATRMVRWKDISRLSVTERLICIVSLALRKDELSVRIHCKSCRGVIVGLIGVLCNVMNEKEQIGCNSSLREDRSGSTNYFRVQIPKLQGFVPCRVVERECYL